MKGTTDMKIAIAMTLDDRYAPPARVTIESIHRNGGSKRGVTLVVVSRGLSDASIAALRETSASTGIPIEFRVVEDVSELGAIPDWAVPACLRLFVGDVCADYDRVLFLDADLLILGDLDPLMHCDLGGLSAAAVVHFPPMSVMRVAVPKSRRGDANPEAPYFNAGVVLFDVRRWQERSIGLRSRAFLSRYPATRILDQDAWNVVLSGDWRVLDKEWNVPAGPMDDAPILRGLSHMNPAITEELRSWEPAQQHPRILHYVGQPKPWESNYPWAELANLYRGYMRPEFGTDWPGYQERLIATDNNELRTREFIRT